MGYRTWWRQGNLRDRNLGGYRGGWFFGTGVRRGRYDTAFEEWCAKRGLLYVRTVELFWAFERHRRGFPQHVDIQGLRKRWRDQKEERRKSQKEGGVEVWRAPSPGEPEFVRQWIRWPHDHRIFDALRPDPGRWQNYYRRKKKYFLTELARYRRILKFWRNCGDRARRTFLRCAGFSNRLPEAHPDYFVVSQQRRSNGVDFGFVEVKGPRESLRLSQRRFFPELVRRGGQKIWLARFRMPGNGISFARFTTTGELIHSDTLFGDQIRTLPGRG